MPATEAVKTLAASFEGMGGATALSLIAFSVVFLVLAGLTLVIFGMRYVSKLAVHTPAPAPAAKKKPAAPAPAPAPAPRPAPAPVPAPAPAPVAASDDGELIAVIAAAIAAQTGAMMAVTSVVPAAVQPAGAACAADAWTACGRLEGLQGALPCRWN